MLYLIMQHTVTYKCWCVCVFTQVAKRNLLFRSVTHITFSTQHYTCTHDFLIMIMSLYHDFFIRPILG